MDLGLRGFRASWVWGLGFREGVLVFSISLYLSIFIIISMYTCQHLCIIYLYLSARMYLHLST